MKARDFVFLRQIAARSPRFFHDERRRGRYLNSRELGRGKKVCVVRESAFLSPVHKIAFRFPPFFDRRAVSSFVPVTANLTFFSNGAVIRVERSFGILVCSVLANESRRLMFRFSIASLHTEF